MTGDADSGYAASPLRDTASPAGYAASPVEMRHPPRDMHIPLGSQAKISKKFFYREMGSGIFGISPETYGISRGDAVSP